MEIDYSKYADGLVPAIVQDSRNGNVLMLGFMNEEARQQTQSTRRVTFYSRSKRRLWTKGEESGNYLELQEIRIDCDNDTLLIMAIPHGPVCHTGAETCFGATQAYQSFVYDLEGVIGDRQLHPSPESYTSGLFGKGINAIAQKLGEEAVELVIESKDNDREKFLGEAADLMFHYLILLRQKGTNFNDVLSVLKKRHAT